MARTKKTSAATPAPSNAGPADGKVTDGNGENGTDGNGNGTDGNGGNGEEGNGKVRYKSLIIDGTKYRTRLNQKFENRQPWQAPDHRKINSSIPGTILRIFVEPGQEVKKGDQMLILEAMKMKNKILFTDDGIVKTIYVKEGDRIPKDHLMLELS